MWKVNPCSPLPGIELWSQCWDCVRVGSSERSPRAEIRVRRNSKANMQSSLCMSRGQASVPLMLKPTPLRWLARSLALTQRWPLPEPLGIAVIFGPLLAPFISCVWCAQRNTLGKRHWKSKREKSQSGPKLFPRNGKCPTFGDFALWGILLWFCWNAAFPQQNIQQTPKIHASFLLKFGSQRSACSTSVKPYCTVQRYTQHFIFSSFYEMLLLFWRAASRVVPIPMPVSEIRYRREYLSPAGSDIFTC